MPEEINLEEMSEAIERNRTAWTSSMDQIAQAARAFRVQPWNVSGETYSVTVEAAPQRTDPVTRCAQEGCEVEKPVREMVRTAGAYYCPDHVGSCAYCHGMYRTDALYPARRRRTSEEQMYCGNCSHECAECHQRRFYADIASTHSGYLCRDCRVSCEDCGNYMSRNGEDCGYCAHRVRGLNGYGKTYPEVWLGGPLPKNKKGVEKGYYLGFELEVTASKGHVKVLNEWAEEGLGNRHALESKEDSSVQGFEIVTQPMTPQFFEQVDWEGFFKVLNNSFPLPNRKRTEPVSHGLHVHIGKVAFANDDIAMAAFCYLIGQSSHLERIARRKATTYCTKVNKPVSATIAHVNYNTGRYQNQASRAAAKGIRAERSAINLLNSNTIEIRAFRSTRKASDLRDAVRLVYVAAEYIRHLRFVERNMPPKSLHWTEFTKWVAGNFPEAFESISGMRSKPPVRG